MNGMRGTSKRNQKRNQMRKHILMSTVALVAGLAVASAQQMPGGQGGAEQKQERGAQSGAQKEQSRGSEAGRSKSEAQGKQQQGKQSEQGKSGESKGGTTGQAQREQGKQAEPKTDQQGRQGQQQGQTGQQPGRQGQQQGQTGQQQGSVQLTTEQRTQIREQVFSQSNVPRADNVNISVRVGTTVPTSVRVVEVPDVLIRIHPEWRSHRYFVVRDEIVIVDNSHRIVSVLPVGSSGGAQLDNRGGGSVGARSGGAMNLSVTEIREVQQVLVR